MHRANIIFLFFLALNSSCQSSLSLTNKGIIVTRRLFSPDSAFVALTFYKDNGAMGASQAISALLRVSDTLGNLDDYALPCYDLPYACIHPEQWLDSRTLLVTLNERPFVRAVIPFP